MDMRVLNKVEDNLWDVLERYADKGISSPDDVETVKHAISGVFKIRCLEEMEEHLIGGSFRNGSSRDGGPSYVYYDDGVHRGSYRRGGRSMDGQSYRYSRGGDMRARLEDMMGSATDEHQRQLIQEMLNRL